MITKDDKEQELGRFYREAFAALHRCWTKAVGTRDYVKADWRVLDKAVDLLRR